MASQEDGDSPKSKRAKFESEENAQDLTPTEVASQNPNNKTDSCPSYARNYLRVSKDNLYMIIALWMEDFVDEKPERYRKVGAVLVLPNDVVVGADCSRDGVHAVARLLMKHYDKAEGSKMFMSRKPCPTCAKLLVQSKVNRLLYLPFEPEYYLSETESAKEHNNTLMKQVDNLFTASSIGQTKFVLQVESEVLDHAETKTPAKDKGHIQFETKALSSKYIPSDSIWLNHVKEKLPWPAFDDKMKAEVLEYFENAMEWIARAKILPGKGLEYDFHKLEANSPRKKDKNGEDQGFNPVANPTHEKQARHLITIARFLAERTDDPKTGVGAVIVSSNMEIVGFGWNGFPLKAQYGEFARASKDDETTSDKKYPYVIHAEQNALLMRNTKNIEGSILFVTKTPCNECAPLIAMERIKTVVVDDDVDLRDEKDPQPNALVYKMFPNMVKNDQFTCYQTVEKQRRDENVKRSLSD